MWVPFPNWHMLLVSCLFQSSNLRKLATHKHVITRYDSVHTCQSGVVCEHPLLYVWKKNF
jgi:hypothetical protein